jgi:hypothetical protein
MLRRRAYFDPFFCAFAAFMLSMRFGYFRPALAAAALARALLFGVSLVCDDFLGFGFFQGLVSSVFMSVQTCIPALGDGSDSPFRSWGKLRWGTVALAPG